MQIEVEKLNEQGEDFEKVYSPEEFSLEDDDAQLASAVRVNAHASRVRGEVLLHGDIDTAVELHCDRCLARVAQPVKIDFKAELGTDEGSVVEATALHDADMDFSTYDGEAINLDEIVREQILLALPARQLCADDCRGLCPTCGANLNEQACNCKRHETDPRWSALAELKKVNGQS
ncbi:MAG: hypothetical protein QOE33_2817 [Acidobacteriota bacterium]|nr:hypothetical protein [Acidobacteriota bacterium]